MQDQGYIGPFEFEDDGKGGRYNVTLVGAILCLISPEGEAQGRRPQPSQAP